MKEICPTEIATELYRISSRLRILSEFSRIAFEQYDGRAEFLDGYVLLQETSKICEDLGIGFLEITT
jgi:hypothetical protein